MRWLALAVLVVPFATALVTLMAGHRADGATKGLAIGGSAIGLCLAWVLGLAHLGDTAPLTATYASTSIGQRIQLAVYVDPLAAVLLMLATTVAFLVQVYSLGYLAHDPRYPSYTTLVSVFTGAMTTVVLADDLWMLLVGWELMGACSYFLIAHHWELPEARAGAVKAFLMTRTADLGLLFAILVLGQRFGSYRISTILRAVSELALQRDQMLLPCVLLVIAVLGKSAQVPFHSWLPDAMPGPTPISALIHAATMVAAGVYLVARMDPLFLSSPSALTLLGLAAAVTMFVGALYATFSNDLKRLLAWSTVSQLAYMFGALAAGAWNAAVLHLLAHGAFKALLFLAAGSVVHAVGGATSLDAMGGLRDKLPDTFLTMTIGLGALAGVVPLVGFFTKDAIVQGAFDEATSGRLLWPAVAWLLLASMVVTAGLTVAYSLRAWLLVFFGPGPEEVLDSPATMTVPLLVLAVPTALGGLVVAVPGLLGNPGGRFAPAPVEPLELFHWPMSIVLTLVAVAVGAFVLRRWAQRGRDLWRSVDVPLLPVDRLYDLVLVRPVRGLAAAVRIGDSDVIETYVEGAGATTRGLGWLLRRAQTGAVQGYLMVVVVGAAAIALVVGLA
jgi:NADH-quinone oxidoreductase subunit L